MDSGIGRTGYRSLAFVFLLVGLLGLTLQWAAIPALDVPAQLGLATTALVLFVFFWFMWGLTASPRPAGPEKRRRGKEKKTRKRAAAAAPPTEDDEPPISFEYSDEPLRTPTLGEQAAAMPAPAPMPAAAPAAVVPAIMDAAPVHRAAPPPPPRPAREELRDRYTQTTPMIREVLTAGGTQTVHEATPEVTARRAPAGARPDGAPEGTSMGRCGRCGTVLYAPTARPLRLKCPACNKVTLLKE